MKRGEKSVSPNFSSEGGCLTVGGSVHATQAQRQTFPWAFEKAAQVEQVTDFMAVKLSEYCFFF